MIRFLLLLTLLAPAPETAFLPAPLGEQLIQPETYASANQLNQAADLVVLGQFTEEMETYPTSRTTPSGRLVNFVQTFQVKRVFKGSPAASTLRVMTTGVEPLPPAADTINIEYPGPLEPGTYVCFLRKLEFGNYYRINGGFQGFYPVMDGKLIALEQGGFSLFSGITIDQFKNKISQMRTN
ncbi:hypothetical protein [Paenibacillus turpanensis]|uniref:hypothetical protein n=1 Tax=Paenibacillus turpanensis TaxID=2689078 RepID=UPI00140A49A6|nr:hypothetical protein [Paenibacillus turpanensis]